ncbi:glycosyltransferase family 2 protein [Flavobacterium sp. RHBU_24]|uniref:glycosyltransferase family 2 protein n=1 Tax=Flavobacterium sp. RHBU_24 TaxID=3391185 RepID=UPI0039854936
MKEITLSVIIVNYNGLPFLKDCFDSIAKQLDGISHEIIVTDNNSADGSCDYIIQHFPDVILIPSSENLGFGKGNNTAVQKASGEYILLLNNDTILQSHLSPALHVLKANSNIGALGINMFNAKGEYLKAGGRFPSVLNLIRLKNITWLGPEFSTGVFSKNLYDIDWLTGSFLLMPKRVYEQVGGFDEDYFMYVEDVDLCKKTALAGYRRVFMPGLSYTHFVGYNAAKDFLIIKGLETYIDKHAKGIDHFFMHCALRINKIVKKIKKKKQV